MIGRSLIIFQLGNNKNELHTTCPWEMAMSRGESRRDKKYDLKKEIAKARKEKKWKPEGIVDDKEVEAICNSSHCADPKEPGYHKWASDSVDVINISDDPNLYNPMVPIIERRNAEHKRQAEAKEQLKKYLPELAKLRNAVPTGKLEITMTLSVRVKVGYEVYSPISNIDVYQGDKKPDYPFQLIDRDELAKFPKIAAIINCPVRKAYERRCKELSDVLGLSEGDIENATYTYADRKEKGVHMRRRRNGPFLCGENSGYIAHKKSEVTCRKCKEKMNRKTA